MNIVNAFLALVRIGDGHFARLTLTIISIKHLRCLSGFITLYVKFSDTTIRHGVRHKLSNVDRTGGKWDILDMITALDSPQPVQQDNQLPADMRERARLLTLRGMNTTDIASTLCIPVERVRKWRVRGKWTAGQQAVQSMVQSIVNSEAVQQVIQERTKASIRARRGLSNVVQQHIDLLEKTPATAETLANTKEGQGLAAVLKTTTETAAILMGWGKEGDSAGMISMGDLDSLDAQTAPVIDVETVPPVDAKPVV